MKEKGRIGQRSYSLFVIRGGRNEEILIVGYRDTLGFLMSDPCAVGE
jgi:hypothetical protein